MTNYLKVFAFGTAMLIVSAPINAAQVLTPIETYCTDTKGPALLEIKNCVTKESKAERKINSFLSKKTIDEQRESIARCAQFVTGQRGLGSQEYVSQHLIWNCLKSKHSKRHFDNCVLWISGKAPQGGVIHWGSQTDSVTGCFNQSVAGP